MDDSWTVRLHQEASWWMDNQLAEALQEMVSRINLDIGPIGNFGRNRNLSKTRSGPADRSNEMYTIK